MDVEVQEPTILTEAEVVDEITKNHIDEIKYIEERDGVITAEAVVDFAKDPNTALHNKFTWDDKHASEQWRLWEARQLISTVKVIVEVDQKEFVTRAFVHYDKGERGYVSIAKVLSDEEKKAKMLATAMNELDTFRNKYSTLNELATVLKAIDALKIKV